LLFFKAIREMFYYVTNTIIKDPLNRLLKKNAEKEKTVKRGMRTENGEIKKREIRKSNEVKNYNDLKHTILCPPPLPPGSFLNT